MATAWKDVGGFGAFVGVDGVVSGMDVGGEGPSVGQAVGGRGQGRGGGEMRVALGWGVRVEVGRVLPETARRTGGTDRLSGWQIERSFCCVPWGLMCPKSPVGGVGRRLPRATTGPVALGDAGLPGAV